MFLTSSAPMSLKPIDSLLLSAEFPKRGVRKWMPKVFERRYRSPYTCRLDTWLEFTVIS